MLYDIKIESKVCTPQCEGAKHVGPAYITEKDGTKRKVSDAHCVKFNSFLIKLDEKFYSSNLYHLPKNLDKKSFYCIVTPEYMEDVEKLGGIPKLRYLGEEISKNANLKVVETYEDECVLCEILL